MQQSVGHGRKGSRPSSNISKFFESVAGYYVTSESFGARSRGAGTGGRGPPSPRSQGLTGAESRTHWQTQFDWFRGGGHWQPRRTRTRIRTQSSRPRPGHWPRLRVRIGLSLPVSESTDTGVQLEGQCPPAGGGPLTVTPAGRALVRHSQGDRDQCRPGARAADRDRCGWRAPDCDSESVTGRLAVPSSLTQSQADSDLARDSDSGPASLHPPRAVMVELRY